ncbi:MAG: alanine racemase [Bacteroidales bacterium]|nr:alanine racemase [Bacteroidales bacterium]MCF8457230.1 alanine racemase [Bacteroidales bacterium]
MQLIRPTLLIDKQKCLRNIESMAKKAKENSLVFRPHFKTHQSVEVGEYFLDFGVEAITVSSVEMAEQFARAGWQDMTIAFPLNIHELPSINHLAENCSINILVENTEVFPFIKKEIKNKIGYFIKIDAGYGRTGLDFKNTDLIDSILSEGENSSMLSFKGFLIHSGNTYHANTVDEILQIHAHNLGAISHLKSRYKKQYPDMIASIGDTPSCSLANDFLGVDEIRPGNFVYYDVMQYFLGSCQLENIAVCVACPVVAIHKGRNEVVVHGGAVHLSKESIEVNGQKIFGLPVKLLSIGWKFLDEGNFVKSLSQEHGIIKLSPEEIEKINIGDFIGIIPVHSCLTANLLRDHQVFV